jgi:segregation and condensation protein B
MALPSSDRPLAEAALERLEERYRVEQRGLQIRRVAGGLRMTTRPEHDRVLRALYRQRNRHRLGRAALETLAVIAYRQPITAPEIGAIRGKDPIGVLKSLLDKRLIRTQGRKRVVGRPFLYATTREFLVHFGLDSLEDLPSMEEFNAMIAEPELPIELGEPLETPGAPGSPGSYARSSVGFDDVDSEHEVDRSPEIDDAPRRPGTAVVEARDLDGEE